MASVVVTDQASIAAVSVSWAARLGQLFTAANGVRLLRAGRNTDLPWININQIQISLSQPEPLSASDVSVLGMAVANYGPVTINPSSGSNTSYTIILAQPIAVADRVTLSIGSSGIIQFTRRLDVVPGDLTDDGYVAGATTWACITRWPAPTMFSPTSPAMVGTI